MSNRQDLQDILNLVSDWLRFAEAKNAAVLAAAGIFLSALLSIRAEEHPLLTMYFWLSLFFLSISAFLAICSFVPQLKAPNLFVRSVDENPDAKVPIYFSDIASMTYDELHGTLSKLGSSSEEAGLERHYIQQIHTNSLNATRKFAIFKASVRCFIIAVFTPVSVIALLIMKKNCDL